jgi:hypothetical protein
MSTADATKIRLTIPMAIALAVSIAGTVGLLLVDHGPWNRPAVEAPATVQYSDTTEAAKSAGATVTPTDPKRAIEPEAPGPKSIQPATPK